MWFFNQFVVFGSEVLHKNLIITHQEKWAKDHDVSV